MKRFTIALALLIGVLGITATEAHAQGRRHDSGVSVHSGRGGFSISIWDYDGYGRGGWGRGPVYGPSRRGCNPRWDDCYGRYPYPNRGGCYDCGPRGGGYYDYDRAPISVVVEESFRDRFGYIVIERRRVTAYWDYQYGGYYWVNRYGSRIYLPY